MAATRAGCTTTKTVYRPGDSAHLVGGGPIAAFEAALCETMGMRYTVCLANATLGLMGTAMAVDLVGKEVVVPALAHPASVAGRLHVGATLRVADVEGDSLTLDLAVARRVVTAATAAVVAVDRFGSPSDTTGIRSMPDDHGLFYLADAAQALAATCDGVHASASADALVLSCTTGKALDAGLGGAPPARTAQKRGSAMAHAQEVP